MAGELGRRPVPSLLHVNGEFDAGEWHRTASSGTVSAELGDQFPVVSAAGHGCFGMVAGRGRGGASRCRASGWQSYSAVITPAARRAAPGEQSRNPANVAARIAAIVAMNSLSMVIGHPGAGSSLGNRKLRTATRRIRAGHQTHAAVDSAPAAGTTNLHVSERTTLCSSPGNAGPRDSNP